VTLSTKAILAKLAYRHGADALTVLSLRMFFALPLLLLSAYFAEKKSATRLTRKASWYRSLCLGVTGYYVSSMLDFLGLMYISAALERLVLFLYPTFVMLISAILFRTTTAFAAPERTLHHLCGHGSGVSARAGAVGR
jgi:drug/metabolite transporter (DMT)-like permease